LTENIDKVIAIDYPATQVTKKKIQESTPESSKKEGRAGKVDGEFDVVCCRKFLILMKNAKFPAAFVFLMVFFLFFHRFSLVFWLFINESKL
jgi:hypothetical protein